MLHRTQFLHTHHIVTRINICHNNGLMLHMHMS